MEYVRINDQGSRQQHAAVQVEGVPASGVVDSGADITIVPVPTNSCFCTTEEEPVEET